MKKLLLYSLLFWVGCKKVESLPICFPTNTEDFERFKRDSSSVLFETTKTDSIDGFPMSENIERYDSLIRVNRRSGWGEFDELCTIYKDQGEYKSQLVLRAPRGMGSNLRKPNSPDFRIIEQSLSPKLWRNFMNYIDIKGLWCNYLPQKQGFSTDGNVSFMLLKSDKNYKYFSWDVFDSNFGMPERGQIATDLESLAQKIQLQSGYPITEYEIYYRIFKDSIEIQPRLSRLSGMTRSFYPKAVFLLSNIDTVQLQFASNYRIHQRDFAIFKQSVELKNVYYDNSSELVKTKQFIKTKQFD